MYVCLDRKLVARYGFILLVISGGASVAAQEPHDAHAGHAQTGDQGIPATRDGSGTSWLPDNSPMFALHRQAGAWTLMGHGAAFLQFLKDGGSRGEEQTGSINWLMGMADRRLGTGHFAVRGMMSVEPWTIGRPRLSRSLATGETCQGDAIHDRQHPHDLFMEIAAKYHRPLGRGVSLELYGGPVAEPALGPVAFMHRVSAMPNPMAPISHHWFDSTHITYGVVTAGLYGTRWKAEGSVFNGREPDDDRIDFDLGRLDSWSGRVWLLPAAGWALQVSAGHLNDAESGHHDELPVDVGRITASATYHRQTAGGSTWATSAGWGGTPSVAPKARWR